MQIRKMKASPPPRMVLCSTTPPASTVSSFPPPEMVRPELVTPEETVVMVGSFAQTAPPPIGNADGPRECYSTRRSGSKRRPDPIFSLARRASNRTGAAPPPSRRCAPRHLPRSAVEETSNMPRSCSSTAKRGRWMAEGQTEEAQRPAKPSEPPRQNTRAMTLSKVALLHRSKFH